MYENKRVTIQEELFIQISKLVNLAVKGGKETLLNKNSTCKIKDKVWHIIKMNQVLLLDMCSFPLVYVLHYNNDISCDKLQ